jgi:hypothetical protein
MVVWRGEGGRRKRSLQSLCVIEWVPDEREHAAGL